MIVGSFTDYLSFIRHCLCFLATHFQHRTGTVMKVGMNKNYEHSQLPGSAVSGHESFGAKKRGWENTDRVRHIDTSFVKESNIEGPPSFADRVNSINRKPSCGSPSSLRIPALPRPAYPWGVNPVQYSSPETNRPESPAGLSRQDKSHIGRVPLPAYYEHPDMQWIQDSEFVDTSSVSTGFEPLLEVIRSFFAFILRGGGSSDDSSSSDSSDSDIEIGLRKPLDPPESSLTESSARISAFDTLHSTPIRFPSSINELLGPAPVSNTFPLDRNLPSDPPPIIPHLPLPVPRNEPC
jgi:hypothetical protein